MSNPKVSSDIVVSFPSTPQRVTHKVTKRGLATYQALCIMAELERVDAQRILDHAHKCKLDSALATALKQQD